MESTSVPLTKVTLDTLRFLIVIPPLLSSMSIWQCWRLTSIGTLAAAPNNLVCVPIMTFSFEVAPSRPIINSIYLKCLILISKIVNFDFILLLSAGQCTKRPVGCMKSLFWSLVRNFFHLLSQKREGFCGGMDGYLLGGSEAVDTECE